MSENYRNYELNSNGEQPWYANENQLMKDIINKLPPQDSSLVGTEHYHSYITNAAGSPVVSVDATSGISTPYLNEGTLIVDSNHKVTSSTYANGGIIDSTAFPDPIPIKPIFLWSESKDALYVGITGAQDWVQVGSVGRFAGATGIQGSQGATGLNIGVTGAVGLIMSGEGATPNVGIKGEIEIPFNCHFRDWKVTSDQSGAAYIETYIGSYASYPNNTLMSQGATGPNLVNQMKNSGTTIGWGSPTGAAGSLLQVRLISDSTIERVSLNMGFNRY